MSQQHQRAFGVRALLTIVAAMIATIRIARMLAAAVAVDVVALVGAALIVRGVSLWSPPAAYIVAGLFLLIAAVRYARVDGK